MGEQIEHIEADETLTACAACERDDIGNSERFRLRFGDLAMNPENHIAIRVANIGWHIFDGMRFKEDEDDRAIRPLAHKVARAIHDEVQFAQPTETEKVILETGEVGASMLADLGSWDSKWDEEKKETYQTSNQQVKTAKEVQASLKARRSAIKKFARTSAGSGRVNAMLQEAGPYVSVSVDDLNDDRYTFNCASGLGRFERLEHAETDAGERSWRIVMRPHSPKELVTKCIPFELDLSEPFDAEKDCPQFKKFFEHAQPKEEMRAFIQRFMGLCLTGLIREQCFLFFIGPGRNGKSTFVELMSYILADYCVTLSIESFSGDSRRSGAEATPDLARLPGARFVAASEGEDGVALKEGMVKTITGGESISVRRLHKEFVEFIPQFKLLLSGNHAPIIKNNDEGIWRRFHLVPWQVQLTRKQVDLELPEKLKTEAKGVFRWMVEGALDYFEHGLEPPQDVLAATEEHRQDMDTIGSFIRSACIVTGYDDDVAAPQTIYEAFCIWCKKESGYQLSASVFNRRFAKESQRTFTDDEGIARQFRKAKQGSTIYRGIKIKKDFKPQEPFHGG